MKRVAKILIISGIALFVAGVVMCLAGSPPTKDYLHTEASPEPPETYDIVAGGSLIGGGVCFIFGFVIWSMGLFRSPVERTILGKSAGNEVPSVPALSKLVAFVVVTVVFGLLVGLIDKQILADISSKTPAEFITSERELHQQGFIMNFFEVLLLGGIYLGAIEFVSYLVRSIMPRKTAILTDMPKVESTGQDSTIRK